MEKPENEFLLKLDRQKFDAILRSISYVFENFDKPWAIDKAEVLLSKKEVGDLLGKLQDANHDGNFALVTMNRNDWIDYSNLVVYSPRVLPVDRMNDIDILEGIADSLEEEGHHFNL